MNSSIQSIPRVLPTPRVLASSVPTMGATMPITTVNQVGMAAGPKVPAGQGRLSCEHQLWDDASRGGLGWSS
jgi:hypothetical protein